LNPKIFDSAELVGYATVNNFSGVAYENAQLKLMAGDVHLIQENRRELQVDRQAGEQDKAEKGGGGGFEEKSFFEYHLYTLGHETTLASWSAPKASGCCGPTSMTARRTRRPPAWSASSRTPRRTVAAWANRCPKA
jgi:hypothetical protein